MSSSHRKVFESSEIAVCARQTAIALRMHPNWFNEHTFRKDRYGTPHSQMEDIWVRYNDIKPYLEKGSMEGFTDMHFPIWYPVAKQLPYVMSLCRYLMHKVGGEHLGAVLITKLPPGGKILPHIDRGWHADFYDKYFIPLQNDEGAVFGFEDGDIHAKIGEVWQFDNSVPHWVNNDSGRDRLSLIVCIRGENPPCRSTS